MKFFYVVQLDVPAASAEDVPPPEFPVLHRVIARVCGSIVVAGVQEWRAAYVPAAIAEYLISAGEVKLETPLPVVGVWSGEPLSGSVLRPSDPDSPHNVPLKSASWWLTPVWPFRRLRPLYLVVALANAVFWVSLGWMLHKTLGS